MFTRQVEVVSFQFPHFAVAPDSRHSSEPQPHDENQMKVTRNSHSAKLRRQYPNLTPFYTHTHITQHELHAFTENRKNLNARCTFPMLLKSQPFPSPFATYRFHFGLLQDKKTPKAFQFPSQMIQSWHQVPQNSFDIDNLFSYLKRLSDFQNKIETLSSSRRVQKTCLIPPPQNLQLLTKTEQHSCTPVGAAAVEHLP